MVKNFKIFLYNILPFVKRLWNDPDLLEPFKPFLIMWLLPGLLIGGTLNQQAWSNTLLIIGRTASALSLLAAVIIVWSTCSEKRWPLAIFTGIIISKAGRIMMGDSYGLYALYTVFLALLVCFAGAAVAFEKKQVIYQQVMFFCLISIPLMIMQLTGFSEWTQILRTDFHGSETIAQVPTLFVAYQNLSILTSQVRPAGFLWASNFLSVIIMFGLGLHYGRVKTGRLNWQDFALCAIAVLAMAKIVFLTFFVIVVWRFLTGDSFQKKKIIKVIILFFSLMIVYAIFFPGVFAYNTSADLLVKNIKGRFHDLAFTMESKSTKDIDNIKPVSKSIDHPEPVSKSIDHVDHKSKSPGASPVESSVESKSTKSIGHESGYASLVENSLPYLIIALFFLIPFYLKGFKQLKFPELKDTTILILFVMILNPLAASFLEGAVFWFIAGFAFLPLLLNAGLINSNNASPVVE